ncbi:hypothetical protein C8R44DRAFT_753806 [Mycena epipterygia]|nr:hypothetical protein C8R44DRAFT_753806 [Mycena epipterygia]
MGTRRAPHLRYAFCLIAQRRKEMDSRSVWEVWMQLSACEMAADPAAYGTQIQRRLRESASNPFLAPELRAMSSTRVANSLWSWCLILFARLFMYLFIFNFSLCDRRTEVFTVVDARLIWSCVRVRELHLKGAGLTAGDVRSCPGSRCLLRGGEGEVPELTGWADIFSDGLAQMGYQY